ncbi:MAG: hypothetical protein ACOYD7_04385 [Raoultibacter sp.]|jgi:hypothetical protein
MNIVGDRKLIQVALACLLALLLAVPSLCWGQLSAEAQEAGNQQLLSVEAEEPTSPLSEKTAPSGVSEEYDKAAPDAPIDASSSNTVIADENMSSEDDGELETAITNESEAAVKSEGENESSLADSTLDQRVSEDASLEQENQETESVSALDENLSPTGGALDPDLAIEGLEWALHAELVPSLDCDKGADPANYSSGLKSGYKCSVAMSFNLKAPNNSFSKGDTVSFPFLTAGPNARIIAPDTAAEPLLDGNIELGTWKIENHQIVIELGEGAAGKSSLKDCSITTAPILVAETYSNSSTTQDYYVGSVKHTYMHDKKERRPASGYLYKSAFTATNQDVRWSIVQVEMSNQLMMSNGASMDDITSIVIEDEFPKETGVVDVSLHSVNASVLFVMSESDHRAAQSDWANALDSSIINYFTKVDQLSGETYAQFKLRVGTFQYGMYKTDAGDIKFIMNLGNPQSTSYPLQYSDIWPNLEETLLNSNVGINAWEANYIATTYSDSNCVNGNIIDPGIVLEARYKQVSEDTSIVNTAYLSFTEQGSQRSWNARGVAVLKAGSANATVQSETATLVKVDAADGTRLGGASFRLERSADGNEPWAEVTTFTTATDGADMGSFNTGNLIPGYY